MTRPPPADAQTREDALDTGRSIILQAPAGSGKTTILTQRFLALLSTVEVPEAILAMTFTRKAAAEMRERILGALRSAAAAAPAKPEEARTWEIARAARAHAEAEGWNLELHPARLRIVTIDALNHSLAAAVPVGARGATSLELVDNPLALYREVARRTLEDAESDPSIAPHSGHVFAMLDNSWEKLEGLLATLLQRRAEWLRHVFGASPDALRQEIEQHLGAMASEALARIDGVFPAALRAEGQGIAADLVAHLRVVKPDAAMIDDLAPLLGVDGRPPPPIGATWADLPAWRALVRLAFTDRSFGGAPSFRRAITKTQGFPPEQPERKARMEAWRDALVDAPGLGEALAALEDAPDPRLVAEDARALEAVIGLLRYAAAQLLLRFREAGQVDHVEVATAARAALQAANGPADDGSDAEVAGRVLHQGAVLRHVLVDEFQDTSFSQFQLLEALVADWTEGDGRTLFAVGDPMQSIYQFREADIGLFTQARERGIGPVRLTSLALTDNFRSQPAVIDFVNDTFRTVFPARTSSREASVPYLRFKASTGSRPAVTPGVHVHALRAGGGTAADTAREAVRVRRVVEDARRQSPSASIAVLVSARNHATRVVDELRGAGIAVQGVELVPLGETPVVQDLVSLTRAIGSPTDRIAWLAVLRAPWCGLDLADLTALCVGAPRATVPELLADPARRASLSPEGTVRLERVRPALEAALAACAVPIALRVESLWLRLGGPRAYADAGALEDARRFLDTLAAETAGTGRIEPSHLETLLDGLYAGSDSISAGAVQVMTIHRAKGLEFDVVVLPGLARRSREDDVGLLEWLSWEEDDGTPRRLLAPTAGVRRDDEEEPRGSARRQLRGLRSIRRLRERARLLYVAMTRARSALHLFATLAPDKKKARVGKPTPPRPPGVRSPLGVLWSALEERFTRSWLEDDGDGIAAAAEAPGLTRRPIDDAEPVWPDDLVVTGLSLPSAELVATPDNGWASDMARLAGTVVHRELERLARVVPLPEASSVEAERPRLRRLLIAEGVVPEELEAALGRVVGALRMTLSQERGRWILSRHPIDDFVEHELTGVYEGRIENIVIDRTFVDDEGTRWVIDHKTSGHEGGDLEAFIATRREHYAAQLRKYKAFAGRLGPQPVRTALYFPLLGGRFEEYDPG